MRIRAGALAVVAGFVLVGCGGSGGSGGTSKDAAGVRATLHQFVNDLLSGDVAGACSLFTTSSLTHTFGSQSGCQQLLAAALKRASKQKLRQEAAKINSTPVTVQGNTATVRDAATGGTTTLIYQNGHWLIASQ